MRVCGHERSLRTDGTMKYLQNSEQDLGGVLGNEV
jgi:hypothetical protein